jgi:AraC-like DNA-binding protein
MTTGTVDTANGGAKSGRTWISRLFMQTCATPLSEIRRTHNDLHIELSPVDRLIVQTPIIGIGEYICSPDHPQFAGGGPETCPYIVFSRLTVKLSPSRGREEICSPVTVNLLDVGDSYGRKPISRTGVHADWIALSPALLREIVREFAPEIADTSASVFNRSVAPISARTFVEQRRFFDAFDGEGADPLAVEEAALCIVTAALREAIGTTQRLPAPSRRRNGIRQIELVEAAKQLLSQDCGSQQSILELAQIVHCSPAYLSRTFKRLAGCSLHDYKQQLRLRASLDLLCEYRFNGAAIATQLGFSSHSHFTDAFRRAFGITPSQFRREASSSQGALKRRLRSHLDHLSRR